MKAKAAARSGEVNKNAGGPERICKTLLVATVALYASLVAFNNLADYDSNLAFVAHTLSMDTTLPDNSGMWRAIHVPLLHHLVYALIILTECLVAIGAWYAAVRFWRARRDPNEFVRVKYFATYSLTLGILLWFGGFIAIGGEWFLMWQSEVWNGIQAAFRITIFLAAVLVFINMDEHN